MIGSLHVDGDSFMHRLSPRMKIVALVVIGILLFFIRSIPVLAVFALIAAIAYFRAGLAPRQALKRLTPVFLTIFVVAVFNFAFISVDQAAAVLLRLTTLMLLAAAVTSTTTVSDFIDEVTALARPLERTGLVRAADIGLAIGLVIRFVPDILARYRAIREAHAARGLAVRPLTILTPLIIFTLRDADAIASAIDARGFRRQ